MLPPPDRGACMLGRLLAMSMAPQIPAEALLDNVVSLRRLASTSDGPNHRGPPLCTDLTHSLHRDGMAQLGERGRLFQAAGWRRLSRPTRDHREDHERRPQCIFACAQATHHQRDREIVRRSHGGRFRQDRLSNEFERKAATAEAGLLHVIGVWRAPYGAISNPRDNAGAAKASRCGRLQQLSLRARTRMEISVQRRPQTARTNMRILRVEAPE